MTQEASVVGSADNREPLGTQGAMMSRGGRVVVGPARSLQDKVADGRVEDPQRIPACSLAGMTSLRSKAMAVVEGDGLFGGLHLPLEIGWS